MTSCNDTAKKSKFNLGVALAFALIGWALMPLVCWMAGNDIPWAFCAVLGLMAVYGFGRSEA